MNEQIKGIVSAMVIVACLGLLGFLVHEKVDGASMAAVAAVTTLVAYFTRAPSQKDPPLGPGIVVAMAAATFLSAMSGCAPLMHNIVRNADCVRDHWGQPREKVILECALTEDNARDIFDLVAQEKTREAAIRAQVGACR